MADTVKKKNPLKIMMIVALFLLVAILVFVLVKKDNIVLESESGERFVGKSGKLLREPDMIDEAVVV